jgi:predicted DNA-binding transcriptional regulator AlpA
MTRFLTPAQLTSLLSSLHADDVPDGLLHRGWYTTEEVAELIGVDTSTLRRWRTAQPPQGPAFVQLTSRVTKYSVPDVEAWLASRRVVPGQAAA